MGNLITRITDCQRRMKTMFEVFDGATPRVLILGLDGAGKTTLMCSAKLDDYIYANSPPQGVTIEHITPRRGAPLQLFDLAGSKLRRHLWHEWFPKTEAIIFVVDSADRVRIDEAKFELHDLLTSSRLRKVPLIVAASKQDLPECMSEDEVATQLDLHSITNRDWSIKGVSKKSKGVMHVFDDVVDKIIAFRHYKSSLTEKQSETKHSVGNNGETKKGDIPVFTNIEETDVTEDEKMPSLFESINNKRTENKPETEDEHTDSGLSSRESVMYDEMNGNRDITDHSVQGSPVPAKDETTDKSSDEHSNEHSVTGRPDSVKDDDSVKSIEKLSNKHSVQGSPSSVKDDESVTSVDVHSSDSGHDENEDAAIDRSSKVSSEDSITVQSVSDVSETDDDSESSESEEETESRNESGKLINVNVNGDIVMQSGEVSDVLEEDLTSLKSNEMINISDVDNSVNENCNAGGSESETEKTAADEIDWIQTKHEYQAEVKNSELNVDTAVTSDEKGDFGDDMVTDLDCLTDEEQDGITKEKSKNFDCLTDKEQDGITKEKLTDIDCLTDEEHDGVTKEKLTDLDCLTDDEHDGVTNT